MSLFGEQNAPRHSCAAREEAGITSKPVSLWRNDSVRGIADKSECVRIFGQYYRWFKENKGSGYTECFFSPEYGSEGGGGASEPGSGGSDGCPVGKKACEGICIDEDRTCCANGKGMSCPMRGQCCFNPKNAHARNGYVCCSTGEQCVYAEGPTSGKCVSPTDPTDPPPPPPPPPATNFFTARICNKSGIPAVWVAQIYYDYVALDRWVVEGWWQIPNGQCRDFRRSLGIHSSSWFSYHAYGGGLTWWDAGQTDDNYCVQYTQFKMPLPQPSCPWKNYKGFRKLPVQKGQVLDIAITK